jgi:hypothetical protein
MALYPKVLPTHRWFRSTQTADEGFGPTKRISCASSRKILIVFSETVENTVAVLL